MPTFLSLSHFFSCMCLYFGLHCTHTQAKSHRITHTHIQKISPIERERERERERESRCAALFVLFWVQKKSNIAIKVGSRIPSSAEDQETLKVKHARIEWRGAHELAGQ